MEPPHAQLLLRGLDGRTRVLSFGRVRTVRCHAVLEAAAEACALPTDAFALLVGTRCLHARTQHDELLVANEAGALPSCDLVLPLSGGKGGFGALLRGAGKGGRITNDDACRDLSGRRLRDVNAEKKLKEWAAGAKERELEKVAERHIREKAGAAARAADATRAAEESLQREHAAIVGQLSTAVRSGLSQAEEQSQLAKRKAEQQRAAVPSKKACFWTLDSEIGREALSDDEDEQPGQQEVTAPVVPEPQPEAPPPPPHAAAPVEAAVEEEAHPQPPIDLAQFSTAAELEALGLDRLKVELTTRGLKCGGTLAERAARLFLLNTVAYDALDAKHKAKGR